MTHELTAELVRPLLPPRPEDGHKGTFGHALVVAGSRGFTGAAKLAVEGAYRAGAGLVTAACPETIIPMVAPGLLEAMWIPLPATPEGAVSSQALAVGIASAKGRDAVVLGPGMSTHEETCRFVLGFLAESPSPVLVDADGLNNLASDVGMLERVSVSVVLTPHPGEMARLIGASVAAVQEARVETARTFASRFNCVVVLKGHRTVIADASGACFVNPTGNSGMATGGTGDVLSGIIGGLLAQGCKARDAALVGVYLHGMAGDIAAARMTARGMIARDLLAAIPEAWRMLEAE